MAEPEMTLSAPDSFVTDGISADWERLDDAHFAWLQATGYGGPITSKMPWRGAIQQTPEGKSDYAALCKYAKELTAEYPEIHISVHDGRRSASNYGNGVL